MGEHRTCERCGAPCPDNVTWWLLEDCTVICADCAAEFPDDDLIDPNCEEELVPQMWEDYTDIEGPGWYEAYPGSDQE